MEIYDKDYYWWIVGKGCSCVGVCWYYIVVIVLELIKLIIDWI